MARTAERRKLLQIGVAKYRQNRAMRGPNRPSAKFKRPLLISDLGWTKEQASEARFRFRNFAPFWDVPGMEVYDEM